jgi:hypothetical protein
VTAPAAFATFSAGAAPAATPAGLTCAWLCHTSGGRTGLDVTAGFTPMQLRRYEKFRRSAFSRAKLKRVRVSLRLSSAKKLSVRSTRLQLVQEASGQSSCSDKVAIVVQAVAKTLVGELVEKGAHAVIPRLWWPLSTSRRRLVF